MSDEALEAASNPTADEVPVGEDELEAARGEREGAAWYRDALEAGPGDGDTTEGATIANPPSSTPISTRAFNLIVEFEVSSQATYESKYRGAIWPQGLSGVTVGIGYDVGYASREQLREDWQGAIPDAMLAALEGVVGITAEPAQDAAAGLRGRIDIPWSAALAVHHNKVMPRWVGLVEGALLNTGVLGPDALGALASLTYNRGASFRKDGDRYREMRAIRQHMAKRRYAAIPAEFRSMKRIWPTVAGLQGRREREAKMFELGLAGTS